MKSALSILLAFALTLSLVAEENGSMPYATLYGFFHDAAGIEDPNLHTIIAVESTNPEVKPSQISLTIQSSKGPLKVTVMADGEIRDFPLTWELLGENPSILSNQPKGTLRLRTALGLKLPDSLTFTYVQLNKLLQEANAAIKKQAGEYSDLAPEGNGLIFEFHSSDKPTVTLASKSGTKTLPTDEHHNITLPLNNETQAENPTITLSEKPAAVWIDFPPRN